MNYHKLDTFMSYAVAVAITAALVAFLMFNLMAPEPEPTPEPQPRIISKEIVTPDAACDEMIYLLGKGFTMTMEFKGGK